MDLARLIVPYFSLWGYRSCISLSDNLYGTLEQMKKERNWLSCTHFTALVSEIEETR